MADDEELADLAPLFSETFELADQVAAQVTPEDTQRAIAAILARAGFTSDPEARPETD